MSLAIVARRYAKALLELGTEGNNLDKIVEDFATVADAWGASVELRNAIENPRVAHPVKRAVMGELADQIGADPTTRNALLLLVDRRRARALPHLAGALSELADAHKGLVRADVTTATPLSEAYYGRLQTQLEKMTGKRVVVNRKTDSTLVGGVITRIGDRVFDGSLRSRLESLSDALVPTP